jgi:hypothetical protein
MPDGGDMTKITSFNLGFIVVDGKQYICDIVILPDGTVKEREPGRGRLGSHKITVEEIEHLQTAQPDIILIGTGTNSMAKLTEDAKIFRQQPDSNLEVLPSPQAVEKFNQLISEGKRVAALFHITC